MLVLFFQGINQAMGSIVILRNMFPGDIAKF